MTALSRTPSLPVRLLKYAGFGFLFGVLGYGVGWLLADYVPHATFEELGLRWSDYAALVVALMLIVGGVFSLVAARSGRALSAATRGHEPASEIEVRDMRLQSAVVILSGMMLAAPPLAIASGNLAPGPTYAALMAVFILHSLMNLNLWRRGDEMIRRVILEAGAVAFWIGQAVLFAWAAAERLGLAPPVTAWDILAVLMSLYLICSMTATVRRGLT